MIFLIVVYWLYTLICMSVICSLSNNTHPSIVLNIRKEKKDKILQAISVQLLGI